MEDAKDDPVIPIKMSINSMVDLVTRIDERVLALKAEQLVYTERLNYLEKTGASSVNFRLQALESNYSKQELRWKGIFTFVMQLVWVVLAAYLLYKLGIQSPQVP
jgi:hypothetical protein